MSGSAAGIFELGHLGDTVLSHAGDVDGLIVVNGLGYETELVAQIQPDTGKQVHLSGDGTVRVGQLIE